MTSFELLYSLKKLNLLENKHPWWRDNSNIEKCIIGAILTQNTKWENVESSFIRSSLIVGHPGEGEKEFNELLEFLEMDYFDRLNFYGILN